MNFKKTNNIVGWLVCLVACATFVLTSEKSDSFWDCGEFVPSAFKLQISHPPGAPFFILLGRIFIILFGDKPMLAAKAVNTMSALASGFAVLFLFWVITHLSRKMVQGTRNISELKGSEIFMIMSAGVVGALAFCFSDSFWFSAVEGIVFALSAFFTSLVFWSMMKWEDAADKPGADKWIVFIFFMMGLAIGVHLLDILTIPSLVMLFYFKKRHLFNYSVMRKYFMWIMAAVGILGFIGAAIRASSTASTASNYSGGATIPTDFTIAALILFGAIVAIALVFLFEKMGGKGKEARYGGTYIMLVFSAILLGFVQVGVIRQTINIAGHVDLFFVNTLKLPIFSGFVFFFIVLAALIWWGLRVAHRKNWGYLRLGLWSLTFIVFGFSTYITTMLRATANPAINMSNVDNPFTLVGYLSRDQYGDFPVLYGQKFTAQPIAFVPGSTQYEKDVDDKGRAFYNPSGRDFHYVYSPDDMMVFSRVWNNSTDRDQTGFYAGFLGIGKDQRTGQFEREPNFVDNIKFFLGYQLYHMYLRYFLWNYSGKQNDLQGSNPSDVRDGNWITGIPIIDNIMLGDQSKMPHQLQINKARNTLFALPLILGLIGMFYHFKRSKDDAFVTFLLFFMTGIAIILYLNQAGNEPRERDYSYCGSTYAFAIWIGIGVFKVRDWLQKISKPAVAAPLASAICLLAVPVRMVQQEWNDHDRSQKTLAPDLAKDYLNSCARNAILFTFGDNDTYPLWYAQEVEGVRPDVRVINNSLLGTDWYINQLREKINESDSMDLIFTRKQIEGNTRNQINYAPKNYPQNTYYDLYDLLKNYVGSDDPSKTQQMMDGSMINTFPVKNVFIPVDKALVMQNGTVDATDSVLDAVRFAFPRNMFFKNDLIEYAIIAANKWKRPIYFSMNQGTGLGREFEQYLRQDGLTYRFVPVLPKTASTDTFYNRLNAEFGGYLTQNIHGDWMYKALMKKQFVFGGANIPGVYFDEENRRHLISIREAFADAAIEMAREGKQEQARQLLERADKEMLQTNFPYAMPSRYGMHNETSFKFLVAAYLARDKKLIDKVSGALKTDLTQELAYFNSLTADQASNYPEMQRAQGLLGAIDQLAKDYAASQNTGELGSPIPMVNDSAKPKAK